MDDQRPQKAWEMTKAWLEEASRTAAANASIDTLTSRTDFVRRRGQVTKMCYFETANSAQGDQAHSKACLSLAGELEQQIKLILKDIPVPSISNAAVPVRIPARAFLKNDLDYEPLSVLLTEPAAWATVNQDDGQLLAVSGGPPSRPAPLRLEMLHSEGRVAVADCVVTDPKTQRPMSAATESIVRRFTDLQTKDINRNARFVLQEQLGKVFDFETKTPRDLPLGQWLEITSTILRMLRTTALANVVQRPRDGS